ncbi:cysteine desulfurase-like protein [Deinococcus peraridilitoris]|uniref:Cysteine desulfurase family protein, VC1184 subfamily n=1 Tax=Deinococcus peraridilitoris (strain DSM 19664 / LMG 22246 / CIP 109416 / KR-200) TaxID=937777 RepID=L0A637_DEIPD|nr:cysteine desulfurase-like protein [Deinococcus peraridilitoris]AFZ69353.1 cysteine desulfurase family protein, VC1184 subfamily [Deinococcus peraridilitoris DSM 19664]
MNRTEIRAQFPSLANGRVYLDNAAGSLLPQHAIDGVTRHLIRYGAINSMIGHQPGREMLNIKHRAREGTALFFNAQPEDVVLGPSATALAFRMATAFTRLWGPGDEVIVSGLEHEANASPWRDLQRSGVSVNVWHARTPDLRLDLEDLKVLLSPRTRLVAVTTASNVLGSTVDIRAVTALAREVGAWTFADAVQSAPHEFPDVQSWGADFVTFSMYKVCGPHLGALWIRPELRAELPWPKLVFFPDADVHGLEHGTPQFELLAGWLGTLDYLRELGGASDLTREALNTAAKCIRELEEPVATHLLAGLVARPNVTVYGPQEMERRVGTVAFRVAGEAPEQTATRLSEQGIDLSAGHFYAVQPMTDLGLYPAGVARASIAHYTSMEDVERLLNALR